MAKDNELNMEEIQKQLALLQLKDLAEVRAKKDEDLKARQEARKMIARNLQAGREEELRRQNLCPHQKPNGQSALSGQWDQNKVITLICPYCAKTFIGRDVPPHLRVDMSIIGGPEYAGAPQTVDTIVH